MRKINHEGDHDPFQNRNKGVGDPDKSQYWKRANLNDDANRKTKMDM